MKKSIEFLLKHKIAVLMIFLAACVVCIFLSDTVSVNYNMADYLPDDAKSTVGMKIMEQEFHQDIPNLRVMIPDISIPRALEYKEKIAYAEGVKEINWLDDAVDIRIPIETQPQNTVEAYYKNGCALYSVTVNKAYEEKAIEKIKEIIGENGIMSGSAVTTVEAKSSTSSELAVIMMIAIPLILVILLLTTSSWIEPVLFLFTIGVAILLNSGTNAIFGEISFVTKAAGSLLQLAVSMDYSIFLLHRFSECREEGLPVQEAMTEAVKKSFSSITASGVTTVIGFASLIIMRFKIGPDMGWVMAKGILFSLLCVLVLLPVLALLCYKLIDRTKHRIFMPRLVHFKGFVYKIRIPVLIIFVILTIPAVLASYNNTFYYGSSHIYSDEGSRVYQEQKKIEEIFGKSNQMVLLLPKGDPAMEKEVSRELKSIPEVISVISYVDSVGSVIPEAFVPAEQLEKLNSEHYTRMVISLDMDIESEKSFGTVEKIRSIGNLSYGDDTYLIGESPTAYDMKNIVEKDNTMVNLIAIIAVAIVLIVTFKSATIPIILLFTIESAIWMNLSVPYFQGSSLFFIGYLIISSIQLGATIDYAILFMNRYMENRRQMTKKETVMQTVSDTTISIMTSASIMTVCAFLLGLFSGNGILSQLGFLLARGAVLSAVMVLFVLPSLLYVFDGLIYKTTYNSKIISERKISYE